MPIKGLNNKSIIYLKPLFLIENRRVRGLLSPFLKHGSIKIVVSLEA